MQFSEKNKFFTSGISDLFERPVRSVQGVPVSSFFSRTYGAVIFVMMCMAVAFLALSMLTYHADDTGFSHISTIDRYGNLFGALGAHVADLTYLLLGWSAWVLIAGGVYILWRGWRRFRGRSFGNTAIPFGFRMIAFIVLLLSSGALFFLRFFSYAGDLPATTGGMAGSTVGAFLLHTFGAVPATLIALIVSAWSAAIFFGFSWIGTAEKLGFMVEDVFRRIRSRKEQQNDEEAGQKAKMQRQKSRTESKEAEKKAPAVAPEPPSIVRPIDKTPIAFDPKKFEPVKSEEDEAVRTNEVMPDTVPTVAGPQSETVSPNKDIPIDAPTPVSLEDKEEQGIEGVAEKIEPAKEFVLPGTTLLDEPPYDRPQVSQEELRLIGERIEHVLANYRIEAKVISAMPGPVVTQYKVKPGEGVPGRRFVAVAKDLARGLGQPSLRVVENLREADCIGLEVPNGNSQTIFLKEIIGSPIFKESASKLTLALGKSIGGEPVVANLAKAPHLLVAGTTGSGKSVGINAMILSMLYKCKPDELKLILVDPKEVEFAPYDGIPHLLTPVITDMMKAVHALDWCVREMDRRYGLMKRVGVKNFDSFNEKIRNEEEKGGFIPNPLSLTPENPEPLKKLPYIIIIIDELADLLLTNGKQVEPRIMRLTQKARAAGMHMILATQRPSTDIVTPIIKTNCPTRISFQVSNRYDSQTILGDAGAEDLLGRGDMFFMRSGHPLDRVHGANVNDHEIARVTEFLKSQAEPEYVDGVTEEVVPEGGEEAPAGAPSGGEKDVFYDQAVNIVLTERKCSISYLQRRLGIGYNRAANLVETMEAAGLVSAPTSTGKREVLAPSSQVLGN